MKRYIKLAVSLALAALLWLAAFSLLHPQANPTLARRQLPDRVPPGDVYIFSDQGIDCNNPPIGGSDFVAHLEPGECVELGARDETSGGPTAAVEHDYGLCTEEGEPHVLYIEATAYSEGYCDSASFWLRRSGTTARYIDLDDSTPCGDGSCKEAEVGYTGTVIITPTQYAGRSVYHIGAMGNSSFCGVGTADIQYMICNMDQAPEPEEPIESDYCPDGIEVVSGSVRLDGGDLWRGNVATEWDRLYTRYTITGNNTARLTAFEGRLNEAEVDRKFYPEYNDGSYVYSFTVPNRTQPYEYCHSPYRDCYDADGYVVGPVADLEFGNGYDTVWLQSACVLEAPRVLTPSEWCTNGLEMLESPVDIDSYNGFWDMTVNGIDYGHITVQYVVENRRYPGSDVIDVLRSTPGVEYSLWWVEHDMRDTQFVTFTVPTTGVVKMYDPELYLEYFNYGMEITLHSVCVRDATDEMLQKREDECHLINPDFVYGLGGWADNGGEVEWTHEIENGAVTLEDEGMVWQRVLQDRGAVYNLEVRARGVDPVGDTLYIGTSTENMVAGGPQVYVYDLGEYMDTYNHEIFIEDNGLVQVSGDDADVDYVCLLEPDDPLPVPNCSWPEWNPQGSGDPLLIYLVKYIAEVLINVACVIVRALALGYNAITRFFKLLLRSIPPLPNPGDGWVSWLEWIGLWGLRVTDWLGVNLWELTDWIPRNSSELIDFLESLYIEFVFWLADQWQVDPFWLLDTLDDIWDEALLFWNEVVIEVDLEFQDLMLLLQYTANVFVVLVNGVREGVSGETVAYIGEDFSGVGRFIWEGVDFMNDAISGTPLSAVNLVALGAIAIGLGQWTLRKFGQALDSVSR